jgi:hypothetical protein
MYVFLSKKLLPDQLLIKSSFLSAVKVLSL